MAKPESSYSNNENGNWIQRLYSRAKSGLGFPRLRFNPGAQPEYTHQSDSRQVDMIYPSEASRFSTSLGYLWSRAGTLRRPLLVVAFAFLILCSFSVSQTYIRPETGTIIKDVARNGYGVLTIHNNWTMDTVGVLTDDNLKPLMAVYIRSKDSFKFEKIDDGSYGLYFTIGNNWDPNEKKFDDILGYYRYNPSLVFQTNENITDVDYSVFELDLYESESSNFVPDVFDFPDLR